MNMFGLNLDYSLSDTVISLIFSYYPFLPSCISVISGISKAGMSKIIR